MNNKKSRKSLFKTIILLFAIGSCIIVFLLLTYWILHEKELSPKTLFEIIVAALAISVPITKFINSYIKKEIDKGIDKEKVKLLEQNVNSSPNQPALNNSDSSVADMVRKTLNSIVTDYPELPITKNLITLINSLDNQSTKSRAVAKVWLDNIDNLWDIAKRSGNMALKDDPYKWIINKNKAKESLDYNIYCCLLWIQRSFNSGIYEYTTQLPKILDEKKTISALEKIKTEILTEELQEELGTYFDELINLIPNL